MKYLSIVCLLGFALTASGTLAQPTLDSLWPNDDGMYFAYQYHRSDLIEGVDYGGPAYLALEGYTTTSGGEAQNLLGEHPASPAKDGGRRPGLLASIQLARPDLSAAIEQKLAGSTKANRWLPFFLHTGYFMKSVSAIQMWQDTWTHPTWTYLTGEITPGATFSHQLVPELADDIYLHGTVVAVDATVVTENAIYTNAVKVDYILDYGISAFADENGNFLGTHHSERRGHVHYVPGVGPVELLEEFTPFVWADCVNEDCPPEISDWIGQVTETQTLSLTQGPVAVEAASWGGIKSMYR
jgi:hypothetical protein